MRIEFPKSVKRDAAARSGGHCEAIWDGERCNARLPRGGFHYDHKNPDFFSKDATLENCEVQCIRCHRKKTAERDIPAIARARRIADKDKNVTGKKHRWGYGRNDPLRKKITGEVVPR